MGYRSFDPPRENAYVKGELFLEFYDLARGVIEVAATEHAVTTGIVELDALNEQYGATDMVRLINDYMLNASIKPFTMEKIKAPTLVIHAVDDTLVPLEHGHLTASRVPGAELLELPSGGHMLIDQQEKAGAEVHKFILEHTA